MSFSSRFAQIPVAELKEQSERADADAVERALRGEVRLSEFATLISPEAGQHLEELCRRSRRLTQQRFGKVIRLFAPLYLSNAKAVAENEIHFATPVHSLELTSIPSTYFRDMSDKSCFISQTEPESSATFVRSVYNECPGIEQVGFVSILP